MLIPLAYRAEPSVHVAVIFCGCFIAPPIIGKRTLGRVVVVVGGGGSSGVKETGPSMVLQSFNILSAMSNPINEYVFLLSGRWER